VVIDTFNLTEVTMPDVGEASLSIVNNPRFGKVRFDGHAIKYQPHTYNFGTDTFKIATGEATDGYTKIQKHITFNLKTSNAFNSLLLNNMQEAVVYDPSTEEPA
jgi:hypothetical protein